MEQPTEVNDAPIEACGCDNEADSKKFPVKMGKRTRNLNVLDQETFDKTPSGWTLLEETSKEGGNGWYTIRRLYHELSESIQTNVYLRCHDGSIIYCGKVQVYDDKLQKVSSSRAFDYEMFLRGDENETVSIEWLIGQYENLEIV